MSIYKKCGIYKIVCLVNNKAYIGQTVNNFGDRRDSHFAKLRGNYHDNAELQSDWNKYGEENFMFEIIEEIPGQELEYLNSRENEVILEYKSMGLAYNISEGKGLRGCHLSEETKRKIGEKNRVNMTGKKASEETKRKMSISQTLRQSNMTDEEKEAFRAKISETKSKTPMSQELRDKLSSLMKNNKRGARYTEEQIRYIRYLYDDMGMAISDIAKEMNIPRGTVDSIVKRTRWKDVL